MSEMLLSTGLLPSTTKSISAAKGNALRNIVKVGLMLSALASVGLESAALGQTLPGTAAYTITPRKPFHDDGRGLGYNLDVDRAKLVTSTNGPTGFVTFGPGGSNLVISIEPRKARVAHLTCKFAGDASNPTDVAGSLRWGSMSSFEHAVISGTGKIEFSMTEKSDGKSRIYLFLSVSGLGTINLESCNVRFTKA